MAVPADARRVELSTGRITNCGSAAGFPDSQTFLYHVPDAIIINEPIFNHNLYYWDGTSLQPTGPQPSPYHDFDYVNKVWIVTPQMQWVIVRSKRNELLIESDLLITRAIEATGSAPQAWVEYRQALRDITTQTDPFNIIWPTKPT